VSSPITRCQVEPRPRGGERDADHQPEGRPPEPRDEDIVGLGRGPAGDLAQHCEQDAMHQRQKQHEDQHPGQPGLPFGQRHVEIGDTHRANTHDCG
jgi:hypothetical protein